MTTTKEVNRQNFPFEKEIVSLDKLIRYIPRVKKQGIPEHFFITGKECVGRKSFINYISQELKENFQMIPFYINNTVVKTIDKLIENILKEFKRKCSFRDFLINTCEELPEGYGLFIVMDDVTSLSDNEEFTNWYKGLFETLLFDEYYLPVVFTLISPPDDFEKLCLINESFTRMFHLIDLMDFIDF